ncbi:MAG: D-2-hydroxyacid dehydrogenase [Kiritimatiellia bacterium]
MKIVVLDGFTLNPGDLDWERLHSLGECAIHDRTPPRLVLERSAGADVILTNKTVLTGDFIRQLPDLKYIGVLATGYNVVDIAAARERGVSVTNIPDYGTTSVAQMVFAHILNLTQRVADHSRSVHAGDWSASEDFCYWNFPLIELDGLTMGIVGLGRIGRAVAKLALAFGMKVLAYSPSVKSADGVKMTDLKNLLSQSDVVSLHCPLTDSNRKFINAGTLALMKPSAFLINTGRGPLVDEAALAAALRGGKLAGAGLDVLSVEPPPKDNPLLNCPNCFITPHIAWATKAARVRLYDIAVKNIEFFMRGRPQNVVNA